MDTLKELFDRWSEMHTQRELARRLKVTDQKVSDYKTGREPMPAQRVAVLAELVDPQNAKDWLWQYVTAKKPSRLASKPAKGPSAGWRVADGLAGAR